MGKSCCRAGSSNAARCGANRATRCFRMAAISQCCCRRSSEHGRSILRWTIRKGGVRSPSDSRAGRKRRCAKRSLRPTGRCRMRTTKSAARHLTMALVADNAVPDLLNDIAAFANRISAAGAVNGLAQTLLKLTVPGVPDFYQGTECWDFSLVDPDNRRPVDFASRVATLDDSPLQALTHNWRDGRIKQARDRAHARAAPRLPCPFRRRQLRAARGARRVRGPHHCLRAPARRRHGRDDRPAGRIADAKRRAGHPLRSGGVARHVRCNKRRSASPIYFAQAKPRALQSASARCSAISRWLS